MSKIKKVLALVLAMAMVLAMSVVSLADGSYSITIENVSGAKIGYTQIIKEDTTTPTGYSFVETLTEKSNFIEALGVTNDQKAIAKLIKAKNPSATISDDDLNKVSAATSARIASALKTISVTTPDDASANSTGTERLSGLNAGYYVIKATDASGKYVYDLMAGFVGSAQQSDTINAKRAAIQLTKTNEDTDHVVGISDTVTFKIETTVPYIDPSAKDPTYKITDVISGADYVVNTNDQVELTVKIDNGEAKKLNVKVTDVTEGAGKTFTVDLTEIIGGAGATTNTNKTLTIEYDARVTGTEVENKATPSVGDHDTFSETSNKVYNGSIEITKNNENNEALKDAVFVIYRIKKSDSGEDYNEYAVVSDGKLTGWSAEKPSIDDAKDAGLVTDDNGKIKVSGFDIGTYYFKEIEAPDTYSINTKDESATVKLADGVTEVSQQSDIVDGSTTMKDTKLSALPSTGGIGTTIFTVVGCLIMIAAAAMFFVSRRKTEK